MQREKNSHCELEVQLIKGFLLAKERKEGKQSRDTSRRNCDFALICYNHPAF
jgi:hypothetical protein